MYIFCIIRSKNEAKLFWACVRIVPRSHNRYCHTSTCCGVTPIIDPHTRPWLRLKYSTLELPDQSKVIVSHHPAAFRLNTIDILKQQTKMDNRLKDRIAIITGGSSGLGAATALRFADSGARIVVADLKSAGIEKQITDKHGKDSAIFVKVDVRIFGLWL